MSQHDFETLRAFLEDREVSIKAAKPLKNGTMLKLIIVDDPADYYITREKKATVLRQGSCPKNADLTFTISPDAVQRLSDFKSDSVGEFGVEFFKIMASDDENMVLEVKLHTGFIGLTRLGFVGILISGGSAVMAYLAKKGFGSMGEIKKAIKKLRGK